MSFFYDLNKKLDSIRATPEVTHQQLNERDMSRAAKGIMKYGKDGMQALRDAEAEGKALDPVRKKYDKYDNKSVDEDRVGPSPITRLPDDEYYQTPNRDAVGSYKGKGPMSPIINPEYKQHVNKVGQAWDKDYEGQKKYIDKTDTNPAYGPKPDETQRLAKRYPAPTKESAGPAAAKPVKPAPAKPSKPAPKGEFMGTIKGGVWTADPPKPGQKGVPAPSGDPEGVREAGAPMTAKQKSFAKLAPPANKITFADKIAGAKKEVDEMLGDVAAEAMRSALGGGRGRNAEMDEERSKGTAFDLSTPRATKPKVGSIERGHKHDIKHTATGRMVTRRTDDQGNSVGADDDADTQAGPRGRGRPKGTKQSIGAKGPSGKSKLMTREGEVDIRDQGEYDQEGDMAKDDIKTIVRHAQALSKVLGDNDNLPEWVQSKLSKIEGMMISIDEYMQNQESDEEEPIAEKAVSKKQQRFMGMVHSAQKGEKPASRAVGKVANTMKPKDTADFAKTKHKGLPEKKKKEVDENSEEGRLTVKQTGPGQTSTTSSTGRVSATIGNGKMSVRPGKPEKQMDDDTDTASVSNKDTSPAKSSSGMSFGKGIYDSMNRDLEQMIAESMTINMSDSTEGNRSLTVTATDDDAMKLAMILKSAGLGGGDMHGSDMHGHMVDENAPDYPTNTQTSNDALQYAGGLNKPKADIAGNGQSTVPVVATRPHNDDDLQRIREMAGIKIRNPLGPTSPEVARMSKDEVNAALRSGMSPDVAAMSDDEVNAAFRSGISPDISDMNPDSDNAEFGKDSIQRMREMAGIREAKKEVDEEKTEEGNLFTSGLEDDDVKIGDKIPGTNAIKKKDIDESIFALTNQWKAYKG